MIRVGIVGCNYGRTVLLPAFRTDPRCEVVALAGTDAARTAELARAANVARGLGDWRALVEDPRGRCRRGRGSARSASPRSRGARSISANRSSSRSRSPPILPARRRCSTPRAQSGRPTMIDFNFPELPSWRRAKAMLGRRRGRTLAPRGGDLERRKPGDAPAPRKLEDARRRRRRSARQFRQPLLSLSRMVLRPDRRPRRPRVPLARPRCGKQHRARARVRVRRRRQPADELRVLSRLRSSHRILRRGRHPRSGQSDRRLLPRLRAEACAPRRQRLAAGRGRGRGHRSISRFPHRAGVAAGAPLHRCLRGRRLARRPASPRAIACNA